MRGFQKSPFYFEVPLCTLGAEKMMQDTLTGICRRAGTILTSYFDRLNPAAVTEKLKNDFVTVADTESEAFIIDALNREFPGIPVQAEETGFSGSETHPERWVIDPLDGTKNFIHSIPYYAISVALVDDAGSRFGIVYDPTHDDVFFAERGKGATLNNESLSLSKSVDPRAAFLATGFPFRDRNRMEQYFALFQEIFIHVSNIRRCGAAALDLAYVAAGRYDGFWEFGLQPWDIAAGTLLIQEAGGIVTDFDGQTNYFLTGEVAAGHPQIYYIIRDALNTILTSEDKPHV